LGWQLLYLLSAKHFDSSVFDYSFRQDFKVLLPKELAKISKESQTDQACLTDHGKAAFCGSLPEVMQR
jgi:hypothetical protein